MCGYLQSNRLGRLGVCAMEAFGLRRVVAALPPELATKVFFLMAVPQLRMRMGACSQEVIENSRFQRFKNS